jgi:protein O-mannosyl-transferase
MAKRKPHKPTPSAVATVPAPAPPPEPISWRFTRAEALVCAALVLASVVIYGQILGFQFINLDDPQYIAENEHVRSGFSWANIVWAFTSTTRFYWHPLTWLTHMLDCQIYGLNPGPHHALNLVLHAANSALLFLLFRRLTGQFWPSAMLGALFAVHPLRVESVAWVAERKDVLSGFFWILTIFAWTHYVRAPSRGRYALAAAALACGLMSKPTVVTLPFVLLLVDYWPLRRWRGFSSIGPLLREKIPLFALAAAASLTTFVGQSQIGATVSASALPLWFRIENAIISYVRYIVTTFAPTNLGVFYPFSRIDSGEFYACLLALAAITFAAIRLAPRPPYLVAGWLWYLGAMIPTIGIVQSGMQSRADRFTYLPLIGVFVMVVWGARDLIKNTRALAITGGLTIAVLSVLSFQQTTYWSDSFRLFEHTIAVTRDNDVLHMNLATLEDKRSNYEAAIPHLVEAIRIEPNNIGARRILAEHYLRFSRTPEAIEQLRQTLRRSPEDLAARKDLARAMVKAGRVREAIEQFRIVLRLDPNDAEARSMLGESQPR